MNRNPIFSLVALLVAEYVGAQEINVETLGDTRFRLSFSTASVIGIDAAQARLLPAAAALCNGVIPEFGRYSFSSTEQIVDDGVSQNQSFTFEQEISCSSATGSDERRAEVPQSLTSDESIAAETVVRAMSIEYFENIGNEKYDEAYAVVAESLREFSTAESWKVSKQSFRSEVGAPISITIARLTVYENPQNAPGPGIYIAADFNNQYELAPLHCGYLMWFRGPDGEFRVIREESGHVTAESLAKIPSAQLPFIRQRLGCISP